ncbi:hypothetical protein SUGI_0189630 [Cryptomeria japonica]|uniref:probable receptor-like serine/threonine-protein kinase At5g57670 n=1 Tax=Cryptomeria japonica TaxID=3369 RepID=UPI0024089F23|nr:probable receptor-like serine/threonine-protein kinase At5g57670 [Cryptomeria japonica]GLJ12376.1 hypothetical protein SUGI_0189630 [Cryptomeria japonica]
MEIIVVGISMLEEEESRELLSWAISVAARPGDTVLALHVLVVKDDKKLESTQNKMDRANAFTINLLGAFTDLCQAKQVKVEAKVLVHSSVEKGLVDEAAASKASFLILGASTDQMKRPTLGVTKYCIQHAPARCSVITVKSRRIPNQTENFPKIYNNLDILDEGIHKLNLKWPPMDLSKTIVSLQKRLLSKIASGNTEVTFTNKRSNIFLQSKEKISPRQALEQDHDVSSHSISKRGVFHQASSDCDEEFVSGLHQQNCLSILRNVNLTFPPLFSSSFGRHSLKGNEKYNSETYHPHGTKGRNATPSIPKPSWRCFTYEEIAQATNNFNPDNIVGRGGYAEVYRGDLQDGQMIAVKRLASGSTDEQKEKDFLTELGIIGHVCHSNTASLIGCCIENGLHLIFDFSPYGSLASALHGPNAQLLEWPIRYKVAIGTARGLHYLHKCCPRRIIHRDIKASNVLLGPDFEPQISDFGLAKWLPRQWTHHSITPIEGTFGYLAPEYFLHGIVDEKTDVYAFGVLLLEIITGRKPSDISEQNFVFWVKPLLESGNISELADPRLGGQYDIHQMQRMVLTSSLCIRQSAIWRPSMSEVLQLLTDVQSPELVESWRLPASKTDEVDDYTDFDEQEYSQRLQSSCPSY